jgi:hypothetical protein
MKHTGLAITLLTLLACLGVASDAADSPSREDLRRALRLFQEETQEYYDHPRAALTLAAIEAQHERLRSLARTAPEQRQAARVIFRRGLGAREVNVFVNEYRVSTHQADVAFSQKDGRDQMSSIPMQFFWRGTPGTRDVIEQFMADSQRQFAVMAAQERAKQDARAAARADHLEWLAKKGRPLVVSISVTAKADLLRLASEDPDVYAVVISRLSDAVQRLDQMREQMSGNTAIQDIPSL